MWKGVGRVGSQVLLCYQNGYMDSFRMSILKSGDKCEFFVCCRGL